MRGCLGVRRVTPLDELRHPGRPFGPECSNWTQRIGIRLVPPDPASGLCCQPIHYSGGILLKMEGLESEKRLALLCGDQVRSAHVASVMQRAKMDAALVFGGMVDWLERGYAVEKSPKKTKAPNT